jgi:hypothetical protein
VTSSTLTGAAPAERSISVAGLFILSLGVPLAMPVEKSGQDEFDFEFGSDFGRHIEAFDPTFAKVLVRYNPEGDRT